MNPNIMDPNGLTFDDLCGIVAPVARKHGILRVYLFGSRARNDSNDQSDFDFCVVTPERYTFVKLISFSQDLERNLGTKVDVVCEEDIYEPFPLEGILHDRRIVFEA